MNRILNIVTTAYRATLEEQDDTILWLSRAVKNAGAETGLLLRGDAVSYLVKGHETGQISFGSKRLAHPPQLDRDIATIAASGTPVFAVAEDLQILGVRHEPHVEGVRVVARDDLPKLFEQYDQIWQW
jgi:sulfur relay (sulfurtransferase) DsrF/TusC family protein